MKTAYGFWIKSLILVAVGIPSTQLIPLKAHPQNPSAPQYQLMKKVVLGGEGGWDYFTADPVTHRLFIGRGNM